MSNMLDHINAYQCTFYMCLLQAHQLKNGESYINKAVAALESCKLRLLLTGTPIQNDLGEYFAMFNTACPGLLGTVSDFRKQFELPILAGRDAGATDKQIEHVSKNINFFP